MTHAAHDTRPNAPQNSIELAISNLPDEIKPRALHHRAQTTHAKAVQMGKHRQSITLRERLHAMQRRKSHIEVAAQHAGVKPDEKVIAEIDSEISAAKEQIAANLKTDVPAGWFDDYAEFIIRHPLPKVAEVKERNEPANVLIEELQDVATPAADAAMKLLKMARSLGRDFDSASPEIQREVQRRAGNEPRFAPLFYPEDFDRNGRFRIAQSGRIEWPRENLGLHLPNHNAAFADDAVSLLCWLFPDEMTLKLTALAKKVAPKNGISAAEKTAAVERAYVEFDRAVRREDAILFALEKQGIFLRKRRIHPAVALRIQVPSKVVSEYAP